MAGSPPADKQNRRWGGLNGLKVVDVKMLKNKLKHFVEENPVKKVLGFLVSDIADSLGERTADEMMAAPLEEQKEHKYNVLGGGYTRIDGKYDVGRKLGEGSFAKVYEATQKATGERYAVKESNKAKLFKSGAQEMMRTEIQVMQRLEGVEGVLQLHDVLEDSRSLYMILELCRGKDVLRTVLDDFERTGAYSESNAATIMKKMILAVQRCHERGVLHRDIKPENFIWTEEGGTGDLKLADFGLSVLWDPSVPITARCGTIPFMAPELFKMEEYTTEPDVWALGCCMCIMLTGDFPFFGNTPKKMARHICHQKLDMEAYPWGYLSQEARDLVSSFLEKDPLRRITLEEALEHHWFHGAAPNISLTRTVFTGVQKILQMNKFHQGVLMMLARAYMNGPAGERLRKEFKKRDLDGDGTVSCDELQQWMAASGYYVTDAQAAMVFRQLDTDNSGDLNFEQFVATEIHFRAQVDDVFMQSAFKLMDKDGDGEITHEELQGAMTDAGSSMSEEIERVFRSVDKDDNGSISFDEFFEFWRENIRGSASAQQSGGLPDQSSDIPALDDTVPMHFVSYGDSVATAGPRSMLAGKEFRRQRTIGVNREQESPGEATGAAGK